MHSPSDKGGKEAWYVVDRVVENEENEGGIYV